MTRIILQRFAWLFLLTAGCSSRAAPAPIWIGHLVPLDGANRQQGESALASMQAVLEKARADDWSIAGRTVSVRHVNASRTAKAEAVRLLAVNRVAGLIVGPGLADPGEIASEARTHESASILLDEVVSPQGASVFLLGPDPARRGRALAWLARTKLKKKRAALFIDTRNARCDALGDAFAKSWRKTGELREWPMDVSRLAALKDELARDAPDVVLAAVPAERLVELAKVLPNAPVLYGGPDEEEEVLRRDGSALLKNGLYTATVYTSAAELSALGKDWRERFEKSEGRHPGRSAVLAADGLRLIMAGLEMGRSELKARSSWLELRKQLHKELPNIEEFESVTGTIAMKDGVAQRPLFLVRLEGGKAALVETVKAGEP
jgi:ABC-type branched-subunit amino acid transport system substrate-binding protein